MNNQIKHFPGQKENEFIKYLIHKHWIIYVRLFSFVLVTFLLPAAIYFGILFGANLNSNTERILTVCFLMYLEIVALITFIRWLEDELDLIIVTNERVISIDQVTFLHRTISETELVQIQDVKHVSKGVWSNVFGFGSLEIQTAADKIVFIINDIANPYQMARNIMDVRDALKEKHGIYGSGKTI